MGFLGQGDLATFLPYLATNDKNKLELIHQPLHPEEIINLLKKRHDPFREAISHLDNWLGDFNIEMQNLLLNNLFKNKIQHRKPIDKKFFVVTTDEDRLKELNNYFDNHTNWGKARKKSEEHIKSQLLNQNN